ncbi:MAG TPA: SRPBCC family protein [Nocardioidaceae bacterium]|nr:SRPBCC family protein [Nocardioidaceae bacterium]
MSELATRPRRGVQASILIGAGASMGLGGYLGLVTGAIPVDLGVGRRTRPLGPHSIDIAAPREMVFTILSEPYLGRQTRTEAEKITVLERGTDMVLAAHRTPVRGGLVATTLETVRFTRPERVDFRLTRGPVPHVVEHFALEQHGDRTRLNYAGELGTDLWSLGARWGDIVATAWEDAVRESLDAVGEEAERRYRSTQ